MPGFLGAGWRHFAPIPLGIALALAGLGVWGGVLYASLNGTLAARIGGAEAKAEGARKDAEALIAERQAERRQQLQIEAARMAALVAEAANDSAPKMADVLRDVDDPEARKDAFISAILPLVQRENERIGRDRTRLLELQDSLTRGLAPKSEELVWLTAIAADYEAGRVDPARPGVALAALLEKVDIIPPSLALGQAAEESGWGTSRPAQGRNALFGVQVAAIGGVFSASVPARDGRLQNAGFEHVGQSVSVYMHVLNTKRAYESFRAARADRRRQLKKLSGLDLVSHLTRYSELGVDYVHKIQTLIRRNHLDALDQEAS